MKKIKKEVEDAQELISENQGFLEETLYPIADKNAAKRKAKRRWSRYVFPVSISVVLICSVGFGTWRYTHFGLSYENKQSNIEYLNSTLKNTRLEGDFVTVILTSRTRKKLPVYFKVYQELEEPDISFVMATIYVLVDRNHQAEKGEYYTQQTEFLGYTVYYCETRVVDTGDPITVYGYTAEVFMDTGNERYMLEYSEFRTDEEKNGFWQYLQETIKQK